MTTTSDPRPPWALPSGIPPAHLVRAALRAGSLIDAYGSPVPAARAAYILYPSDALYPPEDLRLGERLLIDCGLLLLTAEHLHPTALLSELVALDDIEAASIVFVRAALSARPESRPFDADGELLPEAVSVAEELISDPDRREALLVELGRKHTEANRAALGLRGEKFVVGRARKELLDLGLSDLAAGVRRLSEFADDLGYDVVAPRVGGKRRLEVKTSARHDEGLLHFFISRYEIDYGLGDDDWAVAACRIRPDGEIDLVGWCRARTLEPYLPLDGEGGRWTSAELDLPITLFEPGLPPAV